MIPALGGLLAAERIGTFELQLARALGRAAGEARDAVLAAVALAGRAAAEGDVCLELRRECTAAELDAWLEALRASALVDSGGGGAPLVLDGAGRLYLRRLWDAEQAVTRALLARAQAAPLPLDSAWLEAALERIFRGQQRAERQRRAAATALQRQLCVISGGPGTGKTSVVARVLALLAEQARVRGERAPRALLLAPTGRAAARLGAAVGEAARQVEGLEAARSSLPERAQTLHRALGLRADGSTGPPVPGRLRADVVVVDEVSMVDLALMARLCEALPPAAKLILLGDRDQLASVEAGAVLADLCGSEDRDGSGAGLAGCIVVLRETWRYPRGSGIGRLARAVQAGDAEAALALLEDPALGDVERCESATALRERVLAGYTYTEECDPEARLRAFERFRVLCAHARGSRGVAGIVLAIQRVLAQAGRIRPAASGIWEDRPIAISRNDVALELFNGDVGLIARADGGALRAVFPGAAPGAPRWIAPIRLPPHATAFAQTVHRSQGSEYDEVALVLPAEASAVTTRELVYTAVTRARARVSIHASPDVLRQALARRSRRSSGLAERLWG